jgi:hypothetical protein
MRVPFEHLFKAIVPAARQAGLNEHDPDFVANGWQHISNILERIIEEHGVPKLIQYPHLRDSMVNIATALRERNLEESDVEIPAKSIRDLKYGFQYLKDAAESQGTVIDTGVTELKLSGKPLFNAATLQKHSKDGEVLRTAHDGINFWMGETFGQHTVRFETPIIGR